jgi:hypothetical protein
LLCSPARSTGTGIDGDIEWDLSSDLVEQAVSGEGVMSGYIDGAMPFG